MHDEGRDSSAEHVFAFYLVGRPGTVGTRGAMDAPWQETTGERSVSVLMGREAKPCSGKQALSGVRPV